MIMTGRWIVEAMHQEAWDLFRKHLMADADDQEKPLSTPVPAFEELSDQAKLAFEMSMNANGIWLMIGGIVRTICDVEQRRNTSRSRRN
jgi:hypothetical protein